jgi:hypothetical protein
MEHFNLRENGRIVQRFGADEHKLLKTDDQRQPIIGSMFPC